MYFTTDGSIHLYTGTPDTSLDLIGEVEIWGDVSDMTLSTSYLQLVQDDTLRSIPTEWCGTWGSDSVECIGSRDPRCAFSTALNQCTTMTKCEESRRPKTTTDRCVQELTEGSFSIAFPDGYSYVEEGTVCVQDTVFVDRVITIYPNASTTEENVYRVTALFPPISDCSIVTEAPVIDPSDKMSGRELGLLAGLLIFAVAFLALLLFTCHSSTRVSQYPDYKLLWSYNTNIRIGNGGGDR
eukprot:sb/3469106/